MIPKEKTSTFEFPYLHRPNYGAIKRGVPLEDKFYTTSLSSINRAKPKSDILKLPL